MSYKKDRPTRKKRLPVSPEARKNTFIGLRVTRGSAPKAPPRLAELQQLRSREGSGETRREVAPPGVSGTHEVKNPKEVGKRRFGGASPSSFGSTPCSARNGFGRGEAHEGRAFGPTSELVSLEGDQRPREQRPEVACITRRRVTDVRLEQSSEVEVGSDGCGVSSDSQRSQGVCSSDGANATNGRRATGAERRSGWSDGRSSEGHIKPMGGCGAKQTHEPQAGSNR